MESTISSLLKRYETGGLTRRDLIQGLALLAAGTAAGSAAAQTAPAPIPWSPLIDHIQINSRDPQRAAEFYQRVMGLELLRVGPAGPNRDCCPEETAFLGVGQRLILAIRRDEPYGSVHHWAMLAPGYTRTSSGLRSRSGAARRLSTTSGGTVRDPDGVLCQLMGSPGAP